MTEDTSSSLSSFRLSSTRTLRRVIYTASADQIQYIRNSDSLFRKKWFCVIAYIG